VSCTAHPRRKRRTEAVPRMLAITGLCVAAALPCQAQRQRKPTYEVRVLGIRGTNANKDISPELKSLVPLLRKQFKYTGFKLEKKGGGRVEEGKSSTTTLIDGYKVKVTPLSRTGKRVKLKVEGFKREKDKDVPKWNTTVTIDRGRYHLQARPLANGDGLIIAISAR
jgi:hypothetical protein